MTARRFIGEHDWYREGADFLVRRQDQLSGFWIGSSHAENDPLVGTSFALLFLSKGRWPVLMSKVKHAPEKDWNQHRHDVNNLTRFVESRWKKDLTWQVTDLRVASVDDLLQSPVLYFCGSANPLPDDPVKAPGNGQQTARLSRSRRLFVRRGLLRRRGLRQGFPRTDVARLSRKGIPACNCSMPEHPIWHYEIPVPAEQVRPLYGVEYGCRTSVIYAPLDPVEKPRPSLSCLWELVEERARRKISRRRAGANRRRAWPSASTFWPTPRTAN